MDQEKFEAQYQTGATRLIDKLREERKNGAIWVYNQAKNKIMTRARIIEFVHTLIKKEARNLPTKVKSNSSLK